MKCHSICQTKTYTKKEQYTLCLLRPVNIFRSKEGYSPPLPVFFFTCLTTKEWKPCPRYADRFWEESKHPENINPLFQRQRNKQAQCNLPSANANILQLAINIQKNRLKERRNKMPLSLSKTDGVLLVGASKQLRSKDIFSSPACLFLYICNNQRVPTQVSCSGWSTLHYPLQSFKRSPHVKRGAIVRELDAVKWEKSVRFFMHQ